jgi:hypothetical protein
MRALRFLRKIVCCLAVFAALAAADSLELRNGRHLQGKYVGGTTTAIGFMTNRTIEYFATSEVLALIFDNNDSSLGGLRPNSMNGNSPSELKGTLRHTSTGARKRTERAGPRLERVNAASVAN